MPPGFPEDESRLRSLSPKTLIAATTFQSGQGSIILRAVGLDIFIHFSFKSAAAQSLEEFLFNEIFQVAATRAQQ